MGVKPAQYRRYARAAILGVGLLAAIVWARYATWDRELAFHHRLQRAIEVRHGARLLETPGTLIDALASVGTGEWRGDTYVVGEMRVHIYYKSGDRARRIHGVDDLLQAAGSEWFAFLWFPENGEESIRIYLFVSGKLMPLVGLPPDLKEPAPWWLQDHLFPGLTPGEWLGTDPLDRGWRAHFNTGDY